MARFTPRTTLFFTLTEGVKSVAGTTASKSFEKFIFSGIGGKSQVTMSCGPSSVKNYDYQRNKLRGMINLASLVPGVGSAAVAFVADGGMCKSAAKHMDWQVFEGSCRDKKGKLWNSGLRMI